VAALPHDAGADADGIKNRIHATLHRHGILHGFSDLFGVKGWRFLEQLTTTADDQPPTPTPTPTTLPPLRDAARRTLAGYLELLAQVRRQIAQVTRELRRQVRKDPGGELWRSLPGVSWVLAYTILAEVGHPSRFKSGRNLSSYSLLVPLADDSGDEDPQAKPLGRHVGHIGRRTLKWAFINAARNAVRKSAYFRSIYDRRTDGGKRDKGRGYIAVAREMSRVGYSCVKNGRRFHEQRPVRQRQQPPCAADECRATTDLLVRSCAGPDRSLAADVV
jgi:transposase